MSFLGLPRELRDQVYESVLVSSEPLLVYCENRTYLEPPQIALEKLDSSSLDAWRNPFSLIPASLSKASRTLLCDLGSSQIALEAAETLYSRNSFDFRGHKGWEQLHLFLESIGSRNRSLLRKLAVQLVEPPVVIASADGTTQDFSGDLVRSPQWMTITTAMATRDASGFPRLERFLDPFIVPCIRLLTTAAAGNQGHCRPPGVDHEQGRLSTMVPASKLTISLESGTIPGLESVFAGHILGMAIPKWDTTIPDLIEAECNRQPSAEDVGAPHHRALDVVYRVLVLRSWIDSKAKERLRALNWEILSIRDYAYSGEGIFQQYIVMLRRAAPNTHIPRSVENP